MKRLVDNIIKLDIHELNTFNFPKNEFFGLEIIKDDVKYEFLIKFSTESEKLICFGSGAVSRKGPEAIDPPVFNRYSWNKEFKESLIYYNDPTRYLDDNLRLGWCVGTKKVYYLDIIAEIIEKLLKKAKIKNKNLLFYGSSGGGFTSIQLATLIKESTALVNNSQFILKHFNLSGHFDDVLKTCFNDLSEKEVFDLYEYRLNVLAMFKKMNYVPRIIYYVNSSSKRDITKQCIPFIEGLNNLYFDNEVEIILYNDKNEHNPLNKKDSIDLIKKVLKTKRNVKYSYDDVEKIKKENELLKKSLKNIKSRKIVKLSNKILNLKKMFFK